MLLVFLLAGCAPMTEQAIEKREAMMYEQMDREEQFKHDEKACLRASGYMKIERNGKAKRRQEILRVPGPGDKWACVTDTWRQ
jgi:hypothetical protein